MKFFEKNKGVFVFYLLILVATLVLVNNNHNNIKDTSLVYVEK